LRLGWTVKRDESRAPTEGLGRDEIAVRLRDRGYWREVIAGIIWLASGREGW